MGSAAASDPFDLDWKAKTFQPIFSQWTKEFEKVYSTATEELERLAVWIENHGKGLGHVME